MASIENRSSFIVTVKNRDDLARTFARNTSGQDALRAYIKELQGQGFKPKLASLNDSYAVRVRQVGYLKRTEAFESWYEHPVDLPGRYYLQAIRDLFRANALANGEFVALGQRINLKNITVPVYLLAGDRDDITPAEQVFNARALLGTPSEEVQQKLVPGGHIGLFMGASTLSTAWPDIARWILDLGHEHG